jgi:hypothetical protein
MPWPESGQDFITVCDTFNRPGRGVTCESVPPCWPRPRLGASQGRASGSGRPDRAAPPGSDQHGQTSTARPARPDQHGQTSTARPARPDQHGQTTGPGRPGQPGHHRADRYDDHQTTSQRRAQMHRDRYPARSRPQSVCRAAHRNARIRARRHTADRPRMSSTPTERVRVIYCHGTISPYYIMS